METKEIGIAGMSCGSCARRIEASIKKGAGVHDAIVNFANKLATVTFDQSLIDVGGIKKLVRDSGYEPYDAA